MIFSSFHNLTVAATEDFKLRFIDLNSNKVIKTIVGHADSVSALSLIKRQPNLLTSGGHDGSLRTWDLRTFSLLND
jgi:WD40 repeat protein